MNIYRMIRAYGDKMAESGSSDAYALMSSDSPNSLETVLEAQNAATAAEAAWQQIADNPLIAPHLGQIATYGLQMYKWAHSLAIWVETDNPGKGRLADMYHIWGEQTLSTLKRELTSN